MKPHTFLQILSIAWLLICGHTFAYVVHPEDASIVGGVFDDTACFNSDGAVASLSECDGGVVDEGMVRNVGGIWKWMAVGPSGINGCGIDPVNPVSSAICEFKTNDEVIADCPFDQYVLVQTTASGHYWAVKANSSCTAIATPEATGLVPCLTSDAFDPVYGCIEPIPSEITIDGGFIKLDTSTERPPAVHCLENAHEGRMIMDSVHGKLYICTDVGWESFTTDPP